MRKTLPPLSPATKLAVQRVRAQGQPMPGCTWTRKHQDLIVAAAEGDPAAVEAVRAQGVIADAERQRGLIHRPHDDTCSVCSGLYVGPYAARCICSDDPDECPYCGEDYQWCRC